MDKIYSPIKERVIKFIDKQRIIKEEFYEKTGISSSNFKSSGAKSELGGDKIAKILSCYPDLSPEWLLTGIGKMFKNNEPDQPRAGNEVNEDAVIYKLSPSIMNVPVVSTYAYAGYLSGYSDPEYIDHLPTLPFIVDKEYKGRYVAFEIRGDSMNDGSINGYLPGDIVLCREVQRIHWVNKLHINRWDFIIVHNTDGILLKKISHHNPQTGDIVAHSINTMYEDIAMNLKDVWQLFNVVRVDRNK